MIKGRRKLLTVSKLHRQNKKSLQMQQLVGALKSVYVHMHCIHIRILHLRSFKISETRRFWNQEWPSTFIVSKSNMWFTDWEARQLKKKLPESSVEMKISVHHVQTDKSYAWNRLKGLFVGIGGVRRWGCHKFSTVWSAVSVLVILRALWF